MLKACIFDLDGTLANSLESIAHVANKMLAGFGYPPRPLEKFKYYCGEGADLLVRRCLLDSGDKELTHYDEGRRWYRDAFQKDPMYKVTHYPGMPETLQELKRSGVKLAVCTNKPHAAAVKVIQGMFGDLFDVVQGQCPELKRKPDPESPLKIAAQLGVLPQECMYVGDTATDMQTGKNAGMYTVGALWGFRTREELEENHADVLAETPEDLLDLFEEYTEEEEG